MSAFKSAWLDWEPTKIPTQRTDKADRSPSVSTVSATDRRFQPEIGGPADRESSLKPLTRHTDKADKSPQADVHEHAVTRWLWENPPQDIDEDHCAACGGPIGPDMADLRILGDGAVVCYGPLRGGLKCYRAYQEKRRAEAEAALRGQDDL